MDDSSESLTACLLSGLDHLFPAQPMYDSVDSLIYPYRITLPLLIS